ncbi:hypothetical protein [Bacillus sp. AFS041924]|nr:hypothetical protein [Bacillus sp. AFS041924]
MEDDINTIEKLAKEFELEGKIKLKEWTQLDDSIYLDGILKYTSNYEQIE